MLIDRMRRGTHDRADATGPCRGCATAVSCRAASCMSRRPCPRPVCYGAHCTSVAQTCRAARRVTRQLLPRSPTDVPAPSGQRRRRTYPDNCYKRQAEAARGGDLDQIAAITKATHAHMPPAAAFPTHACCCRRDACIPYAWRKEDAAGMLAGSPKLAGRGRFERKSRVSAAGRRGHHPNAHGWMVIFAHTAGSYRCASRARLRLHGAVSFAS